MTQNMHETLMNTRFFRRRGRPGAKIGKKTRPPDVSVNSPSSQTPTRPFRPVAWEEIALQCCPEFAHEYDENDAKGPHASFTVLYIGM